MDRNTAVFLFAGGVVGSLSARRAWIEMNLIRPFLLLTIVALRKESVDRNLADDAHFVTVCVALRKESVDRNCYKV